MTYKASILVWSVLGLVVMLSACSAMYDYDDVRLVNDLSGVYH